MEVKITSVNNGFIVASDDATYVFEVNDSEAEALQGMLLFLLDLFGNGSRYSDKRVYVTVAPGDKHESAPEGAP